MDRHERRRPALPHDEDDLREAFFDGRLDEHAWCELKRELAPRSKAANLELARDLASLAVDGGSLYIGVDEKAPDGNPLSPQPLAGLRERVDQVAQSRVAPALFIESYEIPASEQPGYGYLEVVVRASADAPHQVEGVYYGRSDTGKYRLSDPQVERLMREREQQRHVVEDGLRALIAADPYQGASRAYPHLFVVARPGVRRSEMWRDVIGADQNSAAAPQPVQRRDQRCRQTHVHHDASRVGRHAGNLDHGTSADHRGRGPGVVATRRARARPTSGTTRNSESTRTVT